MGALMSWAFGKDKPVATRLRKSTQRQRESGRRKKVKVCNRVRASRPSWYTTIRNIYDDPELFLCQEVLTQQNDQQQQQQQPQQPQQQQEPSNNAAGGGGQHRNVQNKRQNVRGRRLAAQAKPGTSKMNHKASDVNESGENSGVVADAAAESSTTVAAKDDDPQTQKVRELEMEKQRLLDEKLCKICLDQQVGVSFLPCGHFVSCVECARALKVCPICRAAVRDTVRTYMT